MIQTLSRSRYVTLLCFATITVLALSTGVWAGSPDFVPCDTDVDCNDSDACTQDRCLVFNDDDCGDVDDNGVITAADALHALRFATGLTSGCAPSRCDVDMSGTVTATDALRLLRSAIGIASGIACRSECFFETISCDDGNSCNGEEFCMPNLGCVVTQELSCDDGDPCTTDTCDDEDGCRHEPLDCNDGNACNGEEICDPGVGCVSGPGLDCDDGSDCTVDDCDPNEGCVNSASDCDDGDACTVSMCSDDGGCAHEPVNCDDGDVCNGAETCDGEFGCVAGVPLGCDDGSFCNGQETCGAISGCAAGEAPDCTDDDECTQDSCDEDAGACAHLDLGGAMDVLSFSGLPEGTVVVEVYGDAGNGPVAVHGTNAHLGESNAAVIYDSACSSGECSGKGADLGTPNATFDGPGVGLGGEAGAAFENAAAQGNVLIVAKDLVDVAPVDGLVDAPQDQGHEQAVSVYLDFSAIGPVTVKSLRIMDVDGSEAPAVIDVYGADDALLASVAAPMTGDNGIATVELGKVAGAMSMTVSLYGSGAIDDVGFATGSCVRSTTTLPPVATTSTTMMPYTSTTLVPRR